MYTHVKILRKTDTKAAFPELGEKTIHYCQLDRVCVLENGMTSGRASVSMTIDLPDGSIAFIQTSARNFEMMAAVIRGACQSWGEDNT